MKYLIALFTIHCSLFAVSAAQQPMELLLFAFAGRIVDYAHVAYDADTVVEIRIKAKDGTVLAKTKTRTGGSSAYNYAIWVPLASQAIAGHVAVGDEVVFEFVDPDGRIYTGLVPAAHAKIGNPGDKARVDVILASDENHDGVADEYVETLEYLMWVNGIDEYDANADYDGDGQSNYAEYVAGSNPFDKTDTFSVREMALEKGLDGYVAIRVFVSQGRSYTVKATPSLDGKEVDWKPTDFAVADPTAALQGRISTGPSEVGYRTIFVKKEGARRFWRVHVE